MEETTARMQRWFPQAQQSRSSCSVLFSGSIFYLRREGVGTRGSVHVHLGTNCNIRPACVQVCRWSTCRLHNTCIICDTWGSDGYDRSHASSTPSLRPSREERWAKRTQGWSTHHLERLRLIWDTAQNFMNGRCACSLVKSKSFLEDKHAIQDCRLYFKLQTCVKLRLLHFFFKRIHCKLCLNLVQKDNLIQVSQVLAKMVLWTPGLIFLYQYIAFGCIYLMATLECSTFSRQCDGFDRRWGQENLELPAVPKRSKAKPEGGVVAKWAVWWVVRIFVKSFIK